MEIDAAALGELFRDYRSMTYLLAIAETNSDTSLVVDSLRKSKGLADKLGSNPLLSPDNPACKIVREDVEKVRRLYEEKISVF